MAVNSEQDYFINPKALSFTPNYQGCKNIVYVSIVSNAAIKVFLSHVSGLGYGVDAQPQTWRLSGTTTALGTASAYFIYARLSRTKQTADIIFSVRDYTVEGGYSYTDSEGNAQTVEKSAEYFYIKIGSLTETDIAGDKATVNRVLTYASGELDTFKQRNEKSDSVFEQMFEFVSSGVEKLINVKQPFKSITVAGESLFKGLVTFVRGFVLGEKEITAIATSEDDYNEGANDSTLPTTGYVQKEIEALDDHFLIKDDADAEQSVAGAVTFEKDVTVQGDHAVEGVQTIGKEDAAGNIDVNKVVQEVKGKQILHGGFQTPNFFQQGDIIQGAQVDADGNAAFTSITAPVMQIYELQYNRKTAVQEEFIFSDGDTIETVTYIQADGTEIDSTAYNGEEYSYIRLGVRKQYEGYMTTFKDEDILYSNVNIIGESGQPATTGKCWMRVLPEENSLGVLPISSDGLFINALLYSEAQCPGNVNMAPTPHMVISRHGNANGTLHPDRQSVFIISTKAENMVQLRGISSPIIPSEGAYGVVIGKLPKTLLEYVRQYAAYVSENEPYVYARGIIVQDIIRLDYQGLLVKTEVYRGQWSLAIAKGEVDGEPRYMNTESTYDTVTHNGALWACQQSGTTVEPNDSTTEWVKKVSFSFAIYELKPSVNIIYYRPETGLSTNLINVVVGVQSDKGDFDIDDQYTLESHGLRVEWSIDGKGERHILNISPVAAIELEDGSGIIAAEGGEGLYLEGEELDISKIEDNITLYLMNNDKQEASYIIPVVKDADASFKSIVFTRSNKRPATPSSDAKDVNIGSEEEPNIVKYNVFSNPIPTETYDDGKTLIWSDGIPQGAEKVWMTSRTFYKDPKKMSASYWSTPSDMTDTADLETMYSADLNPATLPLTFGEVNFSKEGVKINEDWLTAANAIGWFDEPSECRSEPKYMAVTKFKNGVWSEFKVSRIQGESVFTSVAFTRSATRPEKPSNTVDDKGRNTYDNPLPSEKIEDTGDYIWSATIPDGTDKVWMTTRVFTNIPANQEQYTWSAPQGLTDTADIETMYSALDSPEPLPLTFTFDDDDDKNDVHFSKDGVDINEDWLTAANAIGWYDEAEQCINDQKVKAAPKYMAVSTAKNGVWSAWQIATTQGEPTVTYTIVADKGTLKVGDTQILLHIIKSAGTSSSRIDLGDLDGIGMYITASLNGNVISVSHSKGGIFGLNIAKDDIVSVQLMEGDVVKAELSIRESGGNDGTDGKDGDSPLLLGANPSSISVTIDAASQKTIGDVSVDVLVFIKRGEKIVSPAFDEEWNVSYDRSFISTDYSDTGGILLPVRIPKGTPASEINDIEINFYWGTDVSDVIGTTTITIQKPERGLPGPMGQDGASYYPQGTWNSSTTYQATTSTVDGVEVVTARPIVYYDPAETGNGTYYVLIADSSTGHDPRYYSDKWRPFASLGYVFTEALMAQWARLAKAVFYGDYMFSAYGVDADGAFSEYTKDMFTDGRLNGKFVPSLFLDLLNGSAAFGKLSESFQYFHAQKVVNSELQYNCIHYMNMGRAHNVSVSPRYVPTKQLSNGTYYDYVVVHGAVVLPQYSTASSDAEAEGAKIKWSEDGTHCTIVYQFDKRQRDIDGGNGPSDTPFIVVCSDARMFDTDNYIRTDGVLSYNPILDSDGCNCFVWKGWTSKFIFLSHGSQLKLRSVKTQEQVIDFNTPQITTVTTGINWYVENSADFDVISGKVTMQQTSLDSNGRPNDPVIFDELEFSGTASEEHDTTHIALGGGITKTEIEVGTSISETVHRTQSVFKGVDAYIDLGVGPDGKFTVGFNVI